MLVDFGMLRDKMRINIPAGTPMVMDETDTITFEKWMERVDGLVMRHAGVSVYDLPDCSFHDWYDQRLRPIRAANKTLTMATEDLIYG
mgnify:CR=1 FL=1